MTVNAAQEVPQFDLADRLRKAREQAGLDQGELAHKLGIARTTVSAYESRHVITPDQARALAAALTIAAHEAERR